MTTTEERFRGLPLLETTDLDQALQVTADVFLPHHLQVLERSAPLQMKLNAVHMACLTAGYLRYGPEVRMRTTRASHYHVNIALTGAVRSRSGRRDEVDSARSHAAVFMPGEPADILWGAESAQLCMMLPATVSTASSKACSGTLWVGRWSSTSGWISRRPQQRRGWIPWNSSSGRPPDRTA